MENSDVNISYTSFCRLRPFWVTPPKESDRETCLCKQHDNIQFLANTLFKKKLIKTANLHDLVKTFSCNIQNIFCMYGQCQACKDVRIPLQNIDQNETVSWLKWQTGKEKRIIKNVEKEVKFTTKLEKSGEIAAVADKFSDEMTRFKRHVFNVENQIQQYRFMKEHLSQNEVLIHIDFAENYQCKMTRQIQSMHFGASKRQITLHTGVYYTASKYQTFSAVSDSLDHNPSAVWAFMKPVLDKIFDENPHIEIVHFYSDGPVTQYKQKSNFFLLSSEVEKRNLKVATWNFYESGHGKGVPDGVGGSLKRTANHLVLQGNDITDASFVKLFTRQGSVVFIYQVSEADIAVVTQALEKQSLKPIPGTYKLHQIKTMNTGEIWYRDISCSCEEGELHGGHEWKYCKITQNETKDTSSEEKRNITSDNSKREQFKRESDKVETKDGTSLRTNNGEANVRESND